MFFGLKKNVTFLSKVFFFPRSSQFIRSQLKFIRTTSLETKYSLIYIQKFLCITTRCENNFKFYKLLQFFCRCCFFQFLDLSIFWLDNFFFNLVQKTIFFFCWKCWRVFLMAFVIFDISQILIRSFRTNRAWFLNAFSQNSKERPKNSQDIGKDLDSHENQRSFKWLTFEVQSLRLRFDE